MAEHVVIAAKAAAASRGISFQQYVDEAVAEKNSLGRMRPSDSPNRA